MEESVANSNSNSNTVTQYLLMNVTNAQTLKKGTRNETEVMEN